MRSAPISRSLWRRLKRVRPSRDGSLELRPCRVLLREGRWLDRVFLAEEDAYLRHWQIPPGEDPSRRALAIDAIADVDESPSRLPARIADRLYRAGESGKGYALFTLILSGGRRLPYLTGHAVDFPQWPDDVTPDLVKDVLPHEAPADFAHRTPGPHEAAAPHVWCLYRRPPARWPRAAALAWAALSWGCAAILAERGRALVDRLWPQIAGLEALRWLGSLGEPAAGALKAAAGVGLQAGLIAAPFLRRRSAWIRLLFLVLMAPALALSSRLLSVEDLQLPWTESGRSETVSLVLLWLVPVLNALLLAWPRRAAGVSQAPTGDPSPGS